MDILPSEGVYHRTPYIEKKEREAKTAIRGTKNLLRQGRRVILKNISQKDSSAAKRLEPEYKCHEKLSQKPTTEELVEGVGKSRAFIKRVKGRYGEGLDKKVEALEKILNPGKGTEKVVSFVNMDAWHEAQV